MFVLPLLREHKTPGCPIQGGFSKMILSSLQAPPVILSGFSPVELR
jgi:hypothetical protein